MRHLHPDHIAGTYEGDDLAFPNARYVIGQVEFDEWKSGAKIPDQRRENRDLFLRLIPPLAENMTFIEPGQDAVTGITALQSFGHSLGHMSYLVESEGEACLISGVVRMIEGDTCVTTTIICRQCDLTTTDWSDSDTSSTTADIYLSSNL